MNDWLFDLTALTALFAAFAALANSVQARRAQQSNNVGVYLGMMKEYGSPEMRDAIAALAAFWREHRAAQPDIMEAFRDYAQTDPEGATILRGHCRLVSAYFVNAARLYEAGLIPRTLLILLISHPGLNVFYEVAVPVNLAKSADHNSGRHVRVLQEVVAKHGAGIY